MLGCKGHECFLSPLQPGVSLAYSGGDKKSLQPKELLVCFVSPLGQSAHAAERLQPFCLGLAELIYP